MLDAVDAVVGKGESETELEAALESEGQAADGGSDAGALKVPAQEGRGQIRGHVGVHDARDGAAGDSVPGGAAEPRLLELVDAQMGRDGSVEALLHEDLVALVVGELGRAD